MFYFTKVKYMAECKRRVCLVASAMTRATYLLESVCLDAVGFITPISNSCASLHELTLIPGTPYPLKRFGISLAGGFFCVFVEVSICIALKRKLQWTRWTISFPCQSSLPAVIVLTLTFCSGSANVTVAV